MSSNFLKEEHLDISKGIQNNKLVFILTTKVGKIFVPNSIPNTLLPYLAVIEKERTKK
jgi:hypothetical protein